MTPRAQFDEKMVREFLRDAGLVDREGRRLGEVKETDKSFGTIPYDEKRLIEKAKEGMRALNQQ